MCDAIAGIGYWRAGPEPDVLIWSPRIFAITGIAPSQVPTRAMMDALCHPDDGPRIAAAMAKAWQTGTLDEIRVRLVRPDGTTVHAAIAGQAEGPDIMVGIMRDVTAETEREIELAASRDRALAEKAEAMAVISYNVRPPIADLISSIDMLRGNGPEGQRLVLLDRLSESALAAMGVIDDMLDGMRSDTGRVALTNVDFDLKTMLRTTIDLFQASAAARSIVLHTYGIDGNPAPVRGDSARVQQLVSNLLGDVLRTCEAARISISLSRSRSSDDTDFWMVVIDHEGSAHHNRVSNILAPAHHESVLDLSRHLAEAMGGSIAVSRDPARGSTFSVELPFVRSDVAAPVEETGPLRILLAEDNPINRRLIAALLTRHGHDVTAVDDGRLALRALTEQPFDMVLMDMQMPELDGLAATRAIRALDPPLSETPIIAISAESQAERRRLYFEAGIDNFLPKPIVSHQLLDMIGRTRRVQQAMPGMTGNRFDRERLNLLVEETSYDDAAAFLKMLLQDVRERPTRIAMAIRAGAWDLAAAEADALRALLDRFGSFGLSRLLASISRQCIRRDCPPAVIEELAKQARELGVFLDTELGGLAQPAGPALDRSNRQDFALLG